MFAPLVQVTSFVIPAVILTLLPVADSAVKSYSHLLHATDSALTFFPIFLLPPPGQVNPITSGGTQSRDV